jgi:hypothetical protein
MMDINTGSAPVSPRPFSEIPGLWLKVFQMDEAFFAAEAPRAGHKNTLIAVLIDAVIATIFAFIQSQIRITPLFLERYIGKTPYPSVPVWWQGSTLLLTLLVVPVSFYIFMGLFHLVATAFGGKGNFTTLAYLVSLLYVPLGIAIALVNLIPCLGILIALCLGIYRIILTIRAIQFNYQLTTGKAVWAYFLPTVVILVIILPVCVIGTLALMGPSIGTIFSNVIQGLGTPAP